MALDIFGCKRIKLIMRQEHDKYVIARNHADGRLVGKLGVKAEASGATSWIKGVLKMELLVNIDVADLDAAIRFYERAVGLRLGRRLFEDTAAEMLGASSPIYLMMKQPGSSPSALTSQIRDYQRHWTPVHLDFVVPDLDAAVARALNAGAKIEGQMQTFNWGRQACMSDPFGNGLCLVQWLGRGYNEVA